jgi:hypothetical protein
VITTTGKVGSEDSDCSEHGAPEHISAGFQNDCHREVREARRGDPTGLLRRRTERGFSQ